jgi:hypothetical protein
MINSLELAEEVLEEVHILGREMKFNNEELTPEEQLERAITQVPLPDKQALVHSVEEVFWASILTEEGRPCKPRLIYSPRQRKISWTAQRFVNALPLDRDTLRKLSPAQGPLGYLLWACESGRAEIIGVQGRQAGDSCDFVISSPGYGALDISWSCIRLVTLRAGRLDRYSKIRLPDVSRALSIVRELLGSFAPVFLGYTITSIANEGHGGAVWILRENQSYEGVQLGYRVFRDEFPLMERHSERPKFLESIGHLAGVDGAVLIDARLQVIGFGAFIDVPDSPGKVAFVVDSKTVELRPPSELGGGRHRSAVEFCNRFAPAAAIVVSEDGRISLIWTIDTKSPPFWVPFSILGFSNTVIEGKR